jgi:hypothetical protein
LPFTLTVLSIPEPKTLHLRVSQGSFGAMKNKVKEVACSQPGLFSLADIPPDLHAMTEGTIKHIGNPRRNGWARRQPSTSPLLPSRQQSWPINTFVTAFLLMPVVVVALFA